MSAIIPDHYLHCIYGGELTKTQEQWLLANLSAATKERIAALHISPTVARGPSSKDMAHGAIVSELLTHMGVA